MENPHIRVSQSSNTINSFYPTFPQFNVPNNNNLDIYEALNKRDTSEFEKSIAKENETNKILQNQNIELKKENLKLHQQINDFKTFLDKLKIDEKPRCLNYSALLTNKFEQKEKMNLLEIKIEELMHNFSQTKNKIKVEEIMIDEDLIIDRELKDKDYFSCCICTNLVFDPVMCGSCQTLFCNACITKNKSISTVCPFCKTNFVKANMPKYIKNILDAIKLYCPFSCGDVFKMNNVRNHLMSCKNYGIENTCKACKQKIRIIGNLEQGLKKHLFDCKQVTVSCDNCKKNMKRWEFDDHYSTCDKSVAKCDRCQLSYPQNYSNLHKVFCDFLIGLKMK